MSDLRQTLIAVVAALDRAAIDYMVIGGPPLRPASWFASPRELKSDSAR